MKLPEPEVFDALVEHPGFAALSARIEQMLVDARKDLESDIREEATWKVRGAIATIRTVSGLPAILRAEAEVQMEEEARVRRSVR